jgi:hypothetical protein
MIEVGVHCSDGLAAPRRIGDYFLGEADKRHLDEASDAT